MPAEQLEVTVRTYQNGIVGGVEIEPPLQTFPQYRDACAAAYGSFFGREIYKQLPEPVPSDLERSQHIGATELRFWRPDQDKLAKAGLEVARVLRK